METNDFVAHFNARFRKPHPLREELKAWGLSQSAVANYLGIGPVYFKAMLGGTHRMPAHIEEAIRALIDQARQEAQNAA